MKIVDTGFQKVNNNDTTECIIFENDTCPHCGKLMKIETRKILNNGKLVDIKIRFICSTCGFYCPIKYIENEMIPLYDKSIYKFIMDFGIDIQDRRNKLLSE